MSAPGPSWSPSGPPGQATPSGVPQPGHFLTPGAGADPHGARLAPGGPPLRSGPAYPTAPSAPVGPRAEPGPYAAAGPIAPADPFGPPVPSEGPGGPAPRPFAVTAAAVMTVTAGVQVACLVGFVWLLMYSGSAAFSNDVPQEAAIYHLLARGSLVMAQGLWLPLIGLPLAAFVLGFFVLLRSRWPRVVLTLLGLGSVAWMVWWRSDALAWVAIPAGYVLFCTVLLWTPAVNHWIRTRPRPPEAPR